MTSILGSRIGAWMAAALAALNITIESTTAPLDDKLNYLIDPFQVTYTWGVKNRGEIDEILDRSVIQILENGTIIDGVYYDDVWISHDAAEKFRTNAFDFQTGYAIASNSSGTFATGAGTYDDIPFFKIGDTQTSYQTQHYSIPSAGTYTIGDSTVEIYEYSTSYRGRYIDSLGNTFPSAGSFNPPFEFYLYAMSGGEAGPTSFRAHFSDSRYGYSAGSISDSSLLLRFPFDFDYVSGTIPLPEQDFDPDDGLLIHVPHGEVSPFQEPLSDYPQLGTGLTINSTLPDVSDLLDNIVGIIAPLIDVSLSEYAPQPYVPSPGSIAETPWSNLEHWLSDIKSSILSIPSTIVTVGQDIISSISSIPSAISSLGDKILQDIEEGPIRIFDKVLDLFRTIFAPVFSLVTSGLSIWHYVVSWFSSLSAPLSFLVSVLPSGVWSPVYAVVAGTLCIAIFRRFGK